jgi:penicillin-binding protein 1A
VPNRELFPKYAAAWPTDPHREVDHAAHDAHMSRAAVEHAWELLVADLRAVPKDGAARRSPQPAPLLPGEETDFAAATLFDRRGAELARDLLLDRLHDNPDDLAATRVLQLVSSELAKHPRDYRPQPERIRDLGSSSTTRLRRRVRESSRRARAQVWAWLRNVPPLLWRAWRHTVRAGRRAVRLAVARIRRFRRAWLSVEGLRRTSRFLTRVWAGVLRFGWVVTRALVIAVVAGLIIGGGLAALLVGAAEIIAAHRYTPEPFRLAPLQERSTVYAANGSPLGTLGLEDRELVSYHEIPKVLIDAVVATEDRTFWDNPGIDVAALLRAFVTNIRAGRIVEGGSTITEQLVKNRLLNPNHDAERKIHEMVLATRLARTYTKRQIITEYLNTVYFGEGAYGVESAARRFFLTTDPGAMFPRGKRLNELTVPEAALLAGLIASPSTADPFDHPDQARGRRAIALTRMVAARYITRAQADRADLAPLPSVRPPPDLRPHDLVVDEVQQELLADRRLGATAERRRATLLTGGLKIFTTIDPVAQSRALDAIRAVLPNQPPFTAAVVAMDPNTGSVRTMVGGIGFDQLQYNLVTHQPGRQPGSTYKVVTLAAALEGGYSPNDRVNGTSPCTAFRPGYPIWNTTNAEPGGGTITLRNATINSVNCGYAHVIASLGPPAVIDMAHRLGITQTIPNYLPITLGAKEATPLELATVASTLAADGNRHNPILVARAVTNEGKVLIDNSHPQGQPMVAPDVIACETDILRHVITNGTGTRARLDNDRDAAGKTGTTDDHADAWFLGYTPQLATVVWMGDPTARTPMTDVGGIEVFGGTYPATVWKTFMDAELAGQPALALPPPGPVCDRPGAAISDGGRG